jgi:hypothetical protein
MTYQARLDCTGRPDIVAQWLKNGRKLDLPPVISDLESFVKSWWFWWTNLQPEWQKGSGEILSREINGGWSSICKGGSNGFFMVVLTLAWWLDGINGVTGDDEFSKALNEVNWVLDNLLSSSKRTCDEELDKGAIKKRYILSASSTSRHLFCFKQENLNLLLYYILRL